MNQEVFAAVADALERGEPAALVTIVSTHGLDAAARRREDARLRRRPDRRHDRRRLLRERRVLEGARGDHRAARPQLVHYELSTTTSRRRPASICGGQMDVYIEPIEPSPELYIIGAGHVGFHLARLAHEVGFRVHVVDDREKFANARALPDRRGDRRRRHPGVDRARTICRRTPTSSSSRAATPTISRRCARWRRATCAISGLIGSRAKVARIYDALDGRRHAGRACCKRVHAPIGLDIGAVTPQEIAVSILAELIAVKHGKTRPRPSMRWTPPAAQAQSKLNSQSLHRALTQFDRLSMSLLIRGGIVLTMNDRLDVVEGDVSIRDGRIAAIGAEPRRAARSRRSTRAAATCCPASSRRTSISARRCSAATPTICALMDWLRHARVADGSRAHAGDAARRGAAGDDRAAAAAARPRC